MTEAPLMREFDIVRERWGRYKLPNGVYVLARVFLTFSGPNSANGTELRHKVHLEAVAPPSLKGEPSNKDVRDEDLTDEFDEFEIERTADSAYELDDGTLIFINYKPRKFRMTRLFNKNREPIVRVEAQTDVSILKDAPEGQAAESVAAGAS